MRKSIVTLLLLLSVSVVTYGQSTLTPEEQLEQAQKQLEEAQKALDVAKANAEKAKEEAKKKAEEEAKAKLEKIQKQIEVTKKETARIQEETQKIKEEQASPTTESTEQEVSEPVSAQPEEDQEEVSKPVDEDNSSVIRTRNVSDEDQKIVNNNSIYLAKDAVPVVNGRVVWEKTINAKGKTADEVYDIAEKYLTALTSDDQQLPGSQVGIKNKAKHNLVATVHEWLVFKSNAISLDRTEIYYVLNVNCFNGGAKISMGRIKYNYDVQGTISRYTAEEWITDKNSVNKKRTRLYPISGKFRRKTIDRKNEIFETFKEALQK